MARKWSDESGGHDIYVPEENQEEQRDGAGEPKTTNQEDIDNEEKASVSPDVPLQNRNVSDVDSKTLAEKKVIKTEFNTLVGNLAVVPSDSVLKVKINNTIKLFGFGKYISGKFFVAEIKRTFDAINGYTISFVVHKNKFKDFKDESTIEKEEKPSEKGRDTDIASTKQGGA